MKLAEAPLTVSLHEEQSCAPHPHDTEHKAARRRKLRVALGTLLDSAFCPDSLVLPCCGSPPWWGSVVIDGPRTIRSLRCPKKASSDYPRCGRELAIVQLPGQDEIPKGIAPLSFPEPEGYPAHAKRWPFPTRVLRDVMRYALANGGKFTGHLSKMLEMTATQAIRGMTAEEIAAYATGERPGANQPERREASERQLQSYADFGHTSGVGLQALGSTPTRGISGRETSEPVPPGQAPPQFTSPPSQSTKENWRNTEEGRQFDDAARAFNLAARLAKLGSEVHRSLLMYFPPANGKTDLTPKINGVSYEKMFDTQRRTYQDTLRAFRDASARVANVHSPQADDLRQRSERNMALVKGYLEEIRQHQVNLTGGLSKAESLRAWQEFISSRRSRRPCQMVQEFTSAPSPKREQRQRAARGLASDSPVARGTGVRLGERRVAPRLTGPLSGKRLSGLVLGEKLGEGGFGSVYRAQPDVGSARAVKILRDSSVIDAMRTEAETLLGLRHQNIVGILQANLTADPPHMVLELVEGPSLVELAPLDQDEARAVCEGILAGLAHAHTKGIAHLDLKPQNVLLGESGPKIADFGLARSVTMGREDLEHSLGESGAEGVSGTLAYMAPEQREGQRGDERADMYSFGLLLCELLTGRLPQPGDTLEELLGRRPPLWASALFDRCYCRYEKRFASAVEALDSLANPIPDTGRLDRREATEAQEQSYVRFGHTSGEGFQAPAAALTGKGKAASRTVDSETQGQGFVYVLVNASMPDLVKIGFTTRTPEKRAKELSSPTGVPTPFTVIHSVRARDYELIERTVHKRLSGRRVNAKREYFRVPVQEAIETVDAVKHELEGECQALELSLATLGDCLPQSGSDRVAIPVGRLVRVLPVLTDRPAFRPRPDADPASNTVAVRAVLLSLVWPGLGHLYLGRKVWGSVLALVGAACAILLVGFLLATKTTGSLSLLAQGAFLCGWPWLLAPILARRAALRAGAQPDPDWWPPLGIRFIKERLEQVAEKGEWDGTKRPPNRCRRCGYQWFPRGRNRSTACPECKSRSVSAGSKVNVSHRLGQHFGAGCWLLLLGVFVAAPIVVRVHDALVLEVQEVRARKRLTEAKQGIQPLQGERPKAKVNTPPESTPEPDGAQDQGTDQRAVREKPGQGTADPSGSEVGDGVEPVEIKPLPVERPKAPPTSDAGERATFSPVEESSTTQEDAIYRPLRVDPGLAKKDKPPAWYVLARLLGHDERSGIGRSAIEEAWRQASPAQRERGLRSDGLPGLRSVFSQWAAIWARDRATGKPVFRPREVTDAELDPRTPPGWPREVEGPLWNPRRWAAFPNNSWRRAELERLAAKEIREKGWEWDREHRAEIEAYQRKAADRANPQSPRW